MREIRQQRRGDGEAVRAGRTCSVIQRRSLQDEIAVSREIPRHTSSYLSTAEARPELTRRVVDRRSENSA